jgi:lysine 6-dehydrogenase
VEVPGSGIFEYLATDGLRTLLRSLSHVPTLRELTLRYPGHLEAMRLLGSLGLLGWGEVVVGGCRCPAARILAALLEKSLPQAEDRLVLYVEALRGPEKKSYRLDMEGRSGRTAMSTATGGFLAATAILALRGKLRGFTPPERLGTNRDLYGETMSILGEIGLKIEQRE